MYQFGLLISGVVVTAAVISSGCRQEFNYDTHVAKELRSGIRHDSVFFGIHLGMLRQDFRALCLEMNQQKIFQQGAKGPTVEYRMHELDFPATMDFLPKYEQDTIIEMAVIFEYIKWAPWDKTSHSLALMEDVYNLFTEWYGKPFNTVALPNGKKVLTQVKGNRRILLFAPDDRQVRALISDLTKTDPALEIIDL